MTVADLIAAALKEAGHEVDVITVDSIGKEQLAVFDAWVVGSPSWEDAGKDGQPLPEMTTLLTTLTKEDITNKKIALFGLGDTSYPHFCGAVDVMKSYLDALGVTLVGEPLKIDKYYADPQNESKAVEWAKALGGLLSK